MMFQKTLKQRVKFSGLGVHSGCATTLTLVPAPEDTGIVFCNAAKTTQCFRIGAIVPEAAMHATVIKSNGWYVSTIEHLMAALRMLDIDNVVVEMQGNEVPILDGSALPFVQGFLDAGFQEQHAPRKFLTPREPLRFADDKGRVIEIMPANSFSISYTADFTHPLAGSPALSADISSDFFIDHIAPARTFGFLEQLPFLRQHKLAQGSSLSNSIVIGQELLNDLRFPDECVRHKILDLIGDLGLLPYRLLGTVTAAKTSHNFNRLVAEHFCRHPDQWSVIKTS
jgi:UDP-3-O-[3-hydroxymyristoyl] N-acetylglucosamine deacetylase